MGDRPDSDERKSEAAPTPPRIFAGALAVSPVEAAKLSYQLMRINGQRPQG